MFLTSGGVEGIKIVAAVLARPNANILLPRPLSDVYDPHNIFVEEELITINNKAKCDSLFNKLALLVSPFERALNAATTNTYLNMKGNKLRLLYNGGILEITPFATALGHETPVSVVIDVAETIYGILEKTASLPSGEGPARFAPTAVKDWQPRRKSVSNACERCRRRKIRCDGETPCATCKRFAVQCIRTQKPKEVVASSVPSLSQKTALQQPCRAGHLLTKMQLTLGCKGNIERLLKVEYTSSKPNSPDM